MSALLVPLLAAGLIAGCSPATKKSRLATSAGNYFEAKEYEKAKIEYLNLLKADPQSAIAIERLGVIWFEQGALIQALPFLRKTIELAPDNVEARTKLTVVYLTLGAAAEARKEALTILQQAPANARAINFLANTSRTPEELAVAAEHLQKFPNRDTAAFHLASASLSFRSGDMPSAEKSSEQALIVEPKSPEAHASAARLHLLGKDPDKADAEFKQAVELAPVRSSFPLQYAEFLQQRGELVKAKGVLEDVTRQAPDYLPASNELAQIAFREKRYDDAVKLVETVFSHDSQNLEASLLRNQIWMATGEIKKALEGMEQMDKRYPNIPLIKYHLGRVRLLDNKVSEAIRALNDAVSANPDFADAVMLLSELNLRTGEAPAVVTAMSALLKKRPELAQARLLLAQAYWASGRLPEAAAQLQEQIQAAPNSPQPHLLLGGVLRQQRNLVAARKAFEKTLELAPDDLVVLLQLVDLDLVEEKSADALKRVEAQIQRTPASAAARFIQARVYFAQKDWDRAEAALTKTLDIDPNYSRAYDLLIGTYISANKLDPAIQRLDGLLAKKPDNARALMVSALIYEKKQDYAKARDAYEKLLAVSPDFRPALNNLAYLYAERLNDVDKAYELARKSRQLPSGDPISNASITDTLGWIHYKRRDYQQALALLQDSIARLGDEPEVQFHWGMASYMMGQPDAARTALQVAARGTKEFPGKSEIQARLDFLGESTTAREWGVEELKAILKERPDDVIAHMRLAEAYEKQGAFVDAGAAYEQALRTNPALVAAMRRLTVVYAGPLSKPDKAFDLATKARQLAPNDPTIAAVLGKLTYGRGEFPAAYALLQESARQLPADPVVQHDFGWGAYSMGRTEDARQAMQRALDAGLASPQAEDAKSFLALTATPQQPGETAAIESQIDSALKRDPDHVPALMAQAALHRQRGESEGPVAVYLRVLRRFPDFGPAQRELASLYADDPNMLAKAYEMAMKARNSAPADPRTAEVLATISYKRNDFPFALQLFQESGRKNPLGAQSLYYMGRCQLQAGEKSQGRETLNRALAAGLKEPFASEAKRVLAETDQK